MQVLTGAEMREADRHTIHEIGVPGRALMESAGRAVAGAMEEHLPDLLEQSIVILCGKGNNGGDGLVLLRTLEGLGYDVRAILLSPFEELAPDALNNYQAALKLGVTIDSAHTLSEWEACRKTLERADVIVDAILGTGLTRAAEGWYAEIIDNVNAFDAFKVSVDVPSGLSADTGAVLGAAVAADLTVALAAPKVCHFISPACEYAGRIEVAEIGIPPALLASRPPRLLVSEAEDAQSAWPRRSRSSHKGSFGHLLVVAGSVGKTGAAVMAAEAALRAGAGLVSVATAKSAVAMMAPHAPELMWEPLPETPNGAIDASAADRLAALVAERDAVAIGPGLGRDPATLRLVSDVVAQRSVPTVVDADALLVLANREPLAEGVPVGLTPHPGEAARILGRTTGEIQQDRLGAVRALAASTGAHVLLKGFRSLAADPEGNVRIHLTGNAGMATAGTGDVLTGVVGALLAQGAPMSDALSAAAHVHGLAGDLAAAVSGQTSLVATDVIAKLPDALSALGVD